MKYFGSNPIRLGEPASLVIPVSPWQSAHAAAAALPALIGSSLAGAGFPAFSGTGCAGSRLA